MAKKKAEKKKARVVTTFTDTVELVQGEDPLTLSDLSSLVETATVFMPEGSRVSLVVDYTLPRIVGNAFVEPKRDRITVTTSVVEEETL